MSINNLDKETLKQIATDKSQGGRYYAFERLLVGFGHWSRHNVWPRGLAVFDSNVKSRRAICFNEPVEVFLTIDRLLARYKIDAAYTVQFLAFDLFFLTSAGAKKARASKVSKLKRLLNSDSGYFPYDYAKAYTAMVELIRLDLLKEL